MADSKTLYVHPVTGASKEASGAAGKKLAEDGWQDVTPVERKDNFHPAAKKIQEASDESPAAAKKGDAAPDPAHA